MSNLSDAFHQVELNETSSRFLVYAYSSNTRKDQK